MTDKKRTEETAKNEAVAEAAAKIAENTASDAETAPGVVPASAANAVAPPVEPHAGDTGKLIDALLAAHAKADALEAALSALKTENATLKAETARLSAPVDYAAAMENDDDAEAAAIASPRVRNAVVAAYLKNLGNTERVKVLTGETGTIPLTPVAKPKSLAEAKKLAEILIKG